MRPRRTPYSNSVYHYEGRNEDHDLWSESIHTHEGPAIRSVWELTAEERERIAAGHNIFLQVLGDAQPPVALGTTDEPLGLVEDTRPER